MCVCVRACMSAMDILLLTALKCSHRGAYSLWEMLLVLHLKCCTCTCFVDIDELFFCNFLLYIMSILELFCWLLVMVKVMISVHQRCTDRPELEKFVLQAFNNCALPCILYAPLQNEVWRMICFLLPKLCVVQWWEKEKERDCIWRSPQKL